MIPVLFDSNETTFTSNGLGRLDAISCSVTEELNGLYELELEYPISGPRFKDLVVSNIILALPYDGADPQPFRIYRVSKAMGGRVTVSARHISYQLNWLPVMPFNYSSLADCLTKLKSQSVYTNPFTFVTDKTVTTGGAFTEPLPCRSMLGGVQGSVLQRYGGDYEWDKWTVNLWKRRGSDKGVRISYGKNLVDANQETNIENTYTGICPFYINNDTDEVITLPEKYILASTASNFPFLRIQPVDLSSEWEEQPTIAKLRARAQRYVTDNNIGHPHVSVDVNFIALWQTEEFKNVAPLERVQLGDTVTVHFDKFDLDEQARVVSYEFDVIRERYNSITIGDLKSSLAKTFVEQGAAIEATADELKSDITKSTSWLTRGNGFVVAVKNTDGSWKELLFLDTPSIQTARKVLRINENGIGFSSTGYNGSYAQAWTLDGTLSLGGVNNAYGSLVLLDKQGRITAEFYNEGIWLDEYGQSGQRVSSAYLYGDGVMINESGSNAAAELNAGQISVTDADGTGSHLTGSELSVNEVDAKRYYANGYAGYNGSINFFDAIKLIVRGGIVTGADVGTTNPFTEIWEAIEELQEEIGGGGGGGITDTININPTREVNLEFKNGRLVDYDESPY